MLTYFRISSSTILQIANGIMKQLLETYQSRDDDSALELLGRTIEHHITCVALTQNLSSSTLLTKCQISVWRGVNI